jgi:chemotaxis protein methyltransferase CheR
MTPEYDYIRTLVKRSSAMVLEDGKEYLIQARLAQLVRQEGVPTIESLVAKLRERPDGPLHSRVVEAMTINETSFFRDVNPFEVLRRHVLPALAKARAQTRSINIWSAACSSGQEPYSLAMLLREVFPDLATWKIRIVATDLSSQVLEKAKRGRFTQLEVNRGLPAPMLVKHFVQDGTEWQVKPEVRALVEFRQMNLSAPWQGLPSMDVVLMRNVLIYFDIETKKRLLGNMRETLRPDGYLFLGAAETTFNIDATFEAIEQGRTIYYRRAQATAKEKQ